VNAPLLSRCSVHVLKPLSREDLFSMLERIASSPEFAALSRATFSREAVQVMASAADGDARRCINLLEQLTGTAGNRRITGEAAAELVQSAPLMYDRSGEEHYNLISALHKSMRSGDADAALYWLGRMILSGENPLYIGRRMIRFASEDIGLADPSALTMAMRAVDSYRFLGSPEGDLALAEAVIYLALAPKSNSVYLAWKAVVKETGRSGSQPVPLHLRNAPTALMKELDYGRGYQYAHDTRNGVVTHSNFPRGMDEIEFYSPSSSGREKKISEELRLWKASRASARADERKPDE
jgi:putative ATPase